MKSKYPISKKDKQQQIENLLKVYDFLGRQNRKKELPKNKTDGIKQGGVMHGRTQKNK